MAEFLQKSLAQSKNRSSLLIMKMHLLLWTIKIHWIQCVLCEVRVIPLTWANEWYHLPQSRRRKKSINLCNYIQIVDLWILYGFDMFLWLGGFLIDAVTCFQLSLGNNNISCAISIVTFSVSAWCLLQLLCLSIICIST